MSKLSDYSKFDHLDDGDGSSSDIEKEAPPRPASQSTSSSPDATPPACVIRPHPTIANRFLFEHAGKEIYQFEQSLSEVILYVPAPPQQPGTTIVCHISANKLQLGLKGVGQYFLDESTFSTVDTTDSTWCFEDDDVDGGARKIVIYLQKAAKGVVWAAALKGRFDVTMDALSLQKVQQKLMLERWQEENPGMDFRDASFNGSAPDPRTFMGGVKYD